MNFPEVQRDFSEFLASFNAARVKYLVVGAYALAAHGSPRNTLDLDVLVQPTVANGHRIVQALEAFGFGGLDVTPAAGRAASVAGTATYRWRFLAGTNCLRTSGQPGAPRTSATSRR